MRRSLDVAALRSFVAVVDAGGVTRAANLLRLTQSGVSMQLKRLEDSLGVGLLEREGRGVRPTRRGEELLADARRLIALNDQIVERMTRPEQAGEIKLGLPCDIVAMHGPAVLRAFAHRHPGVRLSLLSDHSVLLLEAMSEGRCDVIVTTEDATPLGAERLAIERLVWAGARGGAAWRRRPPMLAFHRNCMFRRLAFEALERAGIGWDWMIETPSDEAITASVAADLAIAAWLERAVPAQLEAIRHEGALPELPEISINLYRSRGANHELVDLLAQCVREVIALPESARRVA